MFSSTTYFGRVTALVALVASVSWIPSAEAGFIYEAHGVITETVGEFPPSDGHFPFSAGDPFDATLTYTPETAVPSCEAGVDCGCFHNFLSYEIRIGPQRISPYGFPSMDACFNGVGVADYVPDTTFTPDGLFAEELWWLVDVGSDFPTADHFLEKLIGSNWYIFFLAYEGDIRTVYGEVRTASQVPEPATLALLLCGLLALNIGRMGRGKTR